MTQVELAPEVQEDLDRILDHLIEHDVGDASERVMEIIEAIDVLQHNPHIGRYALENFRELVIGRSSRGYVALYTYLEVMNTVVVLAIRSQKEAGYARM